MLPKPFGSLPLRCEGGRRVRLQ